MLGYSTALTIRNILIDEIAPAPSPGKRGRESHDLAAETETCDHVPEGRRYGELEISRGASA